MLLFDKAFHGLGLRERADLNAQVGTVLRIKQGQKLEPYVLLVGRDLTNEDGETHFTATLPNRVVRADYDEFSFDLQTNRMFPRKVVNHILAETIGQTANTIAPPVKNEPKMVQDVTEDREGLSKADIEFRIRVKTKLVQYNDLFREDVRALGRDSTGTLTKKAETAFFAANFGNKLVSLPPIVLIQDGAAKPEHVNDDEIPQIDEIRRYTQWFKLTDVVKGIRQNFPGNPFDPEESGPQFRIDGISFANGNSRKVKSVPIATDALYGLILLSKMETFRTRFRAACNNPETKKPWVSSEDVRAHCAARASLPNPSDLARKWTTYAHEGCTS